MQRKQDFLRFCQEKRVEVERELDSMFGFLPDSEVKGAARYATLGGGHRWRALLAVASSSIYPEVIPPRAALRAGCAMELFHAASLILDDLPSMDNGALRRGKPCTHLAHPRWVVDMAPSYLISLGYRVLLELPGVSGKYRNHLATRAAETAIAMCLGQEKDVRLESGPAKQQGAMKELIECHREKTGLLFGLSAACGAYLSGSNGESLEAFGTQLGIAYQLTDDLADAEESLEELGKSIDQDEAKPTLNRVSDPSRARALRSSFLDEARGSLSALGNRAFFLEHFTYDDFTVLSRS